MADTRNSNSLMHNHNDLEKGIDNGNMSPQSHGYDSNVDSVHITTLHGIIDRILSSRPCPSSTLGNPGPLGLSGFAATTMMLSCWNAGLLSSTTATAVLPMALWYGGTAQLLAGVFEFVCQNTFGATAFCSYGAFWLAYATLVEFSVPEFPSAAGGDITTQAVAMFLLAWLFVSTILFIASFRTSWGLVVVFALLIPTFLLLTIGAFLNNAACTKAGGWFGIFCAFSAWYCSAAIVINTTWGVQLLPIGVIGPYRRPGKAA